MPGRVLPRVVGLDVELQDVLPGRPNLLARLSPSGKTRQRILLAPHLDTVNGVEAQFTPRKSTWTASRTWRVRHQRLSCCHGQFDLRNCQIRKAAGAN